MSSDLDETPAHEGYVAKCIKSPELADRVEKQYVPDRTFELRPALAFIACSVDDALHLVEAFRVPWGDDQRQFGIFCPKLGKYVEQGGLFSAVGASGGDDFSSCRHGDRVGRVRGYLLVELEVPRYHHLFRTGADVLDPFRVSLGLHAEQRHVVEDLAEERFESQIIPVGGR